MTVFRVSEIDQIENDFDEICKTVTYCSRHDIQKVLLILGLKTRSFRNCFGNIYGKRNLIYLLIENIKCHNGMRMTKF